VRFNLLGPLEVRDDGRPVPLGGPQQKAVLAVLLVHANQVVSAERLADQLWDGRPPPTARSLVQGCVAGLRRALAGPPGERGPGRSGDLLLTRAPGYVLRPAPGALDLDRFEELVAEADHAAAQGGASGLTRASGLLREALSLWRGPALDGIRPQVCQAEAARLAERRLVTLEHRIDIDLRLDRHPDLVAELATLVRDHPLREPFWVQLMTALHRSGRQAEALSAYRTVRRELVESLGVEPGVALRRLHQSVLAGADPSRRQPSRPAPGTPPDGSPPQGSATGWAVPAQLPPAVSAFTGRDRYLRLLDNLLGGRGPAGPVPIGVICGTAGVGKTALAVEWAHRNSWRLDGGQLYVNLRGYARTPPLRPVEALTGFLQALGVPAEQVPADPEQASAMYRTLLSGRNTLVVLDDARSAEQVRPLLPGGPGCVVVVTSRDSLGGLVARDGAQHLTLDVLAAEEAAALLSRVLGRRPDASPEAVATMARACAYLPLALRIAAAGLTLSPGRTVDDHVAELGSDRRLGVLAVDTDDDAVRAAFDLSYTDLSQAQRRLFRLLGLAPGSDFTPDDAAALAGTDRRSAELLLARLASAHLVDARGSGRYAFHDLLRLYAGERARQEDPATERTAAVHRLYEDYLRRCRNAADALYPHMLRLPRPDPPPGAPGPTAAPPDPAGPTAAPPDPAGPTAARADPAAAVAWLDAERANLVLAVRAAAEHGPRPAGWLLADVLRGYFHLSRHTADWLVVARAALASAGQDGDLPGQVAARHSLGTVHRAVGEHHEALRHYQEALSLARACDWPESEATTLGNLGIVCRKLCRLAEAAGHLQAALVIDRRIGRQAGEANNLGNLAAVHHDMGRLPEAAADYASALTMSTSIGSLHGQALALTGLGQVRRELGLLDEAQACLAEAFDRYRQIGDRDGQAMVHYSLALVDCDRDRPDQAYRRASTARSLAQDTGDRETESMALNALGRADRLLGRPTQAVEKHGLAYRVAGQTASLRLEGEALIGLAAAHRQLGAFQEAAAFAVRARTLAHRVGLGVVEGDALTQLTDIYFASGQGDLAVQQAGAALAVHRRSGHRPGETRVRRLLDDPPEP
jgi:DNA-binding SARP family transcriptional activator/tetratricopeptide (TPR) repeat protein